MPPTLPTLEARQPMLLDLQHIANPFRRRLRLQHTTSPLSPSRIPLVSRPESAFGDRNVAHSFLTKTRLAENTFRSDPGTGETLWFPTPPVVVPEPEQPSHSFEYLSYLAKQRTLEADQEQIPPLDQDELDAMGQAIEDALKNSQDSDISEVLTPIDFNFELASFGQPGKAGIDPDQFIQALDGELWRSLCKPECLPHLRVSLVDLGLTDSLHAETAEYLVSTPP